MTLLKDAREAAQALHIPVATAVPAPKPRGLVRRDAAADAGAVTSGTLTVTVAPDATCGFNGDGDPVWVCPQGRPCTWESGEINRFWCGWSRLVTTCYDSTAYYDSAICNSDCRANSRNAGCWVASQPNCIELELGNGILSFGCNTEAPNESLDSTRYNKPRDFNTVVFVDGVQKTQWASNLETITTEGPTTTTHSDPEETTSSSSSSAISLPKPGPNIGAIVGGVVGGLAVIGLILLGAFMLMIMRRRKSNAAAQPQLNTSSAPQPETPGLLGKTQWSPNQGGAHTGYNGPQYYTVPVQENMPSPGLVSPTSPTIHEAPSPSQGTVWSAELDGRKADHHRGTMHEMG